VLTLGDQVTWEARHLGMKHRLSTTISAMDAPRMFRDEMVRGPFRRLSHDHFFEPVADGTSMLDVFEFSSGVPPFDALILRPYLQRLLLGRNATIKQLAEGEGWSDFVPARADAASSP
jgi:ligand-binding SRPBCC domain-containing protein